MAITLQAIDHQSEGFDAVSNFNLRCLVEFSMSSAQSDQSFKGSNSNWKNLFYARSLLMLISLSKKVPQLRK